MTSVEREHPVAHLRLLGDYDLVVDGRSRTRDLSYDKPRLLLAMLALAQGKPVPRDELAALLWPESTAQGEGRARLRHALFTLRRTFAELPDALVIEASRLAVRVERFVVDVWDVMGFPAERGMQPAGRLRLYRGPLLDTFALAEGQALAAWRRGWQARIDLELAQCRTQLATRLSSQGHAGAALDHAKRWVALWPDDEAGHRHLIRLLLAEGDRDAAMLAYEHCRQVLMERLGTLPHAETQALIGLDRTASVVSNVLLPRERQHLALAIVAVVAHWRGDSQAVDEPAAAAAQALAEARARLTALAAQRGGWTLPSHDGTCLIYFGYRRAAERPIREAVAFAESAALGSGVLDVVYSVGLHAGIAPVAGGERPDEGGLLTHEAARLAWHAQPGQVRVSEAAADRLDPDHVQTVRPASDSVLLLQRQPEQTRPVRRMFGRSREFDELIRVWAHGQGAREPTAVLLRGQPGIGKSLLVQSMAEYVRQVGGESRVLQGTEDSVDTPCAPVWSWASQMAHDAGLAGSSSPPQPGALIGLGRRLGVRNEALLAWPAAISSAAQVDALRRADQDRLAVHGVLADLLLAVPAPSRPLLLVWEDLHWTHPEGFDLLAQVLRRRLPYPVMLLLSARDEFTAPWPMRELPLRPLEPGALAELVLHRSRGQRLSRRLRACAVEDSGGVPLYVEQILRHASGRQGEDYAPRVADLVAARLNALPAELREMACQVALAGDDATDALLSALGHGEGARAALARHGLAHRHEPDRWRSLPVVCASVLNTVSRGQRRTCHLRVAQALIRLSAPPERIAHHLEAGRDSSASAWWLRASTQAALRGELRAAGECLAPVFERLAHTPEHAYEAWQLQCAVSAGLRGAGAPETMAAARQAAQSRPAGDAAAHFACDWLAWLTCQGSRSHAEALQIAERLHRQAAQTGSPQTRGWAALAVGCEHAWLGDPVKATRMLRQAAQEFGAVRQFTLPYRLHGDPRPMVEGMLAWCTALLGQTARAIELATAAVAGLREGADPTGQSVLRLILARLCYMDGRVEQAADIGRELAALAQVAGAPMWQAVGELYAQMPGLQTGQPAALAAARAAAQAVSEGMPSLEGAMHALLARGLVGAGEPDEALTVLERAGACAERVAARCLEPELLCLRGDAWYRAGQKDLAYLTWREASSHARRMGLELYVQWADRRLMQG